MVRRSEVRSITRRRLLTAAVGGSCALVSGCLGRSGPQEGRLEAVWGRRGATAGRFNRPRAIAVDKEDLLYIVDMTPQIQVFTGDGRFVRGWQTPEFERGRPSGLAFDNAGNLMASDTHYFRVLVYTPQGKLLEEQTLGGTCGSMDGEFQFVTDAAQDAAGNYYVSQYGDYDRIQKFSADKKFLVSWGEHGRELGQFMAPRKIVVDQQGLVWVTDACNHRVQVFDASGGGAKQGAIHEMAGGRLYASGINPEARGSVGAEAKRLKNSTTVKLVKSWGQQGHGPGELNYPYDILLDEAALAGQADGFVYLCEFGNHRVQKFTPEGQFVGSFGRNGRGEGELNQPWGIGRDSLGRMYVLDSYNHRVQRFRL